MWTSTVLVKHVLFEAMRFSLAETMCDPAQYVPLARAAEEAGFHAYTLPDSLAYPEISDSKYPYTPDGNRQFLENKPFIEPFSLAPALGMVTQQLRFHTFVLKLPMRHPVLVAKQAASVAALTHDRFSLGVGLSPWPEDYRITGVPWEGRGKRMDEMMQIMRGLWTGDFFAFDGEHFKIESIKMCPAPGQPIPLLVGGHSEAALRRAARLGDGWMHAGGDGGELLALLEQLNGYRREYGRAEQPFEIHVISMDAYSLDGVRRLEELGVTDVIVGFRKAYEADQTPLEKKLAAIRRYGDSIIAKARAA
jgi:probable F420-dependent oxidoreductase